MTLRVGLMFIKSREKHDISLEWGDNEAIDEKEAFGAMLSTCEFILGKSIINLFKI